METDAYFLLILSIFSYILYCMPVKWLCGIKCVYEYCSNKKVIITLRKLVLIHLYDFLSV